MRNNMVKKLLSVFLVLCMVAAWALPTTAAARGISFKKVDSNKVSGNWFDKETFNKLDSEPLFADTDIVRVSIVLEGDGALDAGYSPEDIAKNDSAMKYRANLKAVQDAMSQKISTAIGEDLDVVWNLTLAGNIISANVPYGKISDIVKVKGVEGVSLENAYEIDIVEKGGDDPNMITSSMQIGSTAAYAAGLTGAGSRIAIIDTGLDVEHISFDPDAYLYSLSQLAARANMDLDTYMEKLDLLDAAEIAGVLPNLNMAAAMGDGMTAEDLFVNEKVPFGFNYVDGNTKITHMTDTEGEHGSHVAGIAAANAYIKTEEGFANALDTVLVQGVAPDAQLMVMKVFGENGGAFDADYMVAIEDAIMLGADSVNLSLGSNFPGYAKVGPAIVYEKIMENLEKSGVVVTISAGNNGSFADYTPYGVTYLDDPMVHTGGSPGTFTNSLGVASAENIGYSGEYMYANGGWLVPFTEPDGYSNAPVGTIAGTHEYVYLKSVGTPEEFDYLLEVLGLESFEGKVVLCDRGGDIDFATKANDAVKRGAEAVIIVNTENKLLNMQLTGYDYTAPVTMIMNFYGQLFSDAKYGATAIKDGEGTAFAWKGTVTINEGPVAGLLGGYENSEMSSFSSWGVPGDLSMKPEITAPGGGIYSVAGAIKTEEGYFFDDHASYESMSGTSMAAPQVAGMAAVMAQYIREAGLEEQTGLDARTLAQSLLMSTAVPMMSSQWKSYYSVQQQGAGLANLSNAIMADSYILMDADATESYADGKVKVELGDDPDRNGKYTFSFYIHNLTAEDEVYTLASDFFTRTPANAGLEDFVWKLDSTTEMYHETTWTVNGAASDGIATVPANGSVKVTATVEIDDSEKAFFDAYCTGGVFVEGFVYAIGEDTPEGEAGTVHSIPVLGFYGSWTDASMYDNGSYIEYSYGMEEQIPYLYEVNWKAGNLNSLFYGPSYDPTGMYYFGGNPVISDDIYMPERNAINSAYPITTVGFTAIRAGAAGFIYAMNTETGEAYLQQFAGGHSEYPELIIPAFFNGQTWALNYTTESVVIDFKAFAEGTNIEVGTIIVPEYYVDAEGNIDFSALNDGAYFSMPMVIDNTAPVLNDINLDGTDLVLNITENQYVAAVAVLDSTGEFLLGAMGSNAEAVAGATADYVMDMTGIDAAGYMVEIYDYAGNISVYEVDDVIGETTDTVDIIEVTPGSMTLNTGVNGHVSAVVLPINATDRTYTWSSSDETVVMVSQDGTVIPVAPGTATITATSNADPSVTGSCEVTVVDIHDTLNAIVWDEVGSIYFSEFSFDTMPEYTKLSPDMLETDYFTSVAVDPDGILYASSFDTYSGEGVLYAMNPKTWEATPIAALPYGLTDMTYAPNMYGHGAIIGTFGSNVIAYDPITGMMMDVPDFFKGATLVGVASVYSAYNDVYGMYEDHFFFIDNEGNLYYEIYMSWFDDDLGFVSVCVTANEDGSHEIFYETGIDKSGAVYFNSLFYDEESGMIYWSAFDETVDNVVDVYAIDLENVMVVKVGSFAEGVWPVGGLFKMPCLHEHTELRDEVTANCTTPGYSGDLYCTDCGNMIEEGHETDIDPDNHAYGEWSETKPNSCTEPGEETRVCAHNPEHTETREVPAHGHSYKAVVTPPTTTSEGYTTHTCEHCGDSYVDNYTNKLPMNPNTGEAFRFELWIPVMLLSFSALAVLVINRKKLA